MGPGLYVHVPFCVRKCAYCAFYSLPIKPSLVESWLSGIQRDLDAVPAGFRPETVFLGGGTPTALKASDLARLLEAVRGKVEMGGVLEWTCEVNPGTLTMEKARLLYEAGVNRLSIGAQSFEDGMLKRLGRVHTAEETRECVAMARGAGFSNIGVDLIYGVPGMSRESLEADVDALLALEPEHVSGYCLEIEPETPFAREAALSRLEIDEDGQREQYDGLRRRLAGAGFRHYEISNFARPGRESRHNGLYWCGGEYIGVGPSAHSHWRGVRWGHTSGLPEWGRKFEERLEPLAKARETLVMGLRRLEGWGREEFREATGVDYEELRGPEIRKLAAAGRLVAEGGRLRLADDALFVSDAVFAELV
jgi:oxygen-independent coproporphyrinogen III oxidase